jgi:hypothetical protein
MTAGLESSLKLQPTLFSANNDASAGSLAATTELKFYETCMRRFHFHDGYPFLDETQLLHSSFYPSFKRISYHPFLWPFATILLMILIHFSILDWRGYRSFSIISLPPL